LIFLFILLKSPCQKPRRQRRNQHTPSLTLATNETVPTWPHLPPNVRGLARLEDPTQEERLSRRANRDEEDNNDNDEGQEGDSSDEEDNEDGSNDQMKKSRWPMLKLQADRLVAKGQGKVCLPLNPFFLLLILKLFA
jgi:hypothetical protein